MLVLYLMSNNSEVGDYLQGVLPELQRAVGVGDYVRFTTSLHPMGLGEIVGIITSEKIKLKLFHPMTSVIMQRNSLQPITPTTYPLAAQDEIMEIFQAVETVTILRDAITDLAFIIPVDEVESVRFSMSGASNIFTIRFVHNGHAMLPWLSSFYFSQRIVESINVRLFHAINNLSDQMRRCLFHRPESSSTSQFFKVQSFPAEAFWYLCHKIATHSIGYSISRKQRCVKYYTSLKLESVAKDCNFVCLHILSNHALHELRSVLGAGIGLGLAINRPTKKFPIAYCMINSNFTCIECNNDIPAEVILNPRKKVTQNGILIVYSEENRILSVNVRFSKMVVKTPGDVTSRLPMAYVASIDSGVYVDALFYYNNVLYEVADIDSSRSLVRCCAVQDLDVVDAILPTDLVMQLVAQFGK